MHSPRPSWFSHLTAAGCLVLSAACGTPSTPATPPQAGDSAQGDTAGGDTGASGDTVAGDAATGDTASGGGLPIGELSNALTEAFCHSFLTCPDAEIRFSSLKSCKAFLAGNDEFSSDEMVKEVQAGTVTYDGVQAAACVAYFKNNCNAFENQKPPLACAKTFVGKVPTGSPCKDSTVCVTGFCDESTDKPNCPGVCAATGKLGADCKQASQCEGSLLCVGGKCSDKTEAQLGDACDGTKCKAGLHCDNEKSVCVPRLEADKVCQPFADECKEGLLCKLSAGEDPTGTCAPPTNAGEACSPGEGDTKGGCVAGHACLNAGADGKPDFKCLPLKKLGEPCAAIGQCIGVDSWCKDVASGKGSCTLLPEQGEACTPGSGFFDCQLPGVCSSTTQKCEPAPGKGQACSGICAKGLECAQGTCEAPPKLGEACFEDGGLACEDDGVCVNGKCAVPVCN